MQDQDLAALQHIPFVSLFFYAFSTLRVDPGDILRSGGMLVSMLHSLMQMHSSEAQSSSSLALDPAIRN